MQGSKKFYEKDFNTETTRHNQLIKYFNIKPIQPKCQDEFIKIPIDLPWSELEEDVNRAFDKFGWYGMIHRMSNSWEQRSGLYGGLGLTYNPDYRFDIPKHAHGLGQPRSIYKHDRATWLSSVESYNYKNLSDTTVPSGMNTYDDPLGLRVPTEVTKFGSFPSVFEKIKRPLFQGRLAQINAEKWGDQITEENKELNWHTDEKNEIVSRLLIPLCYSDDYFIQFKETGNRLYFEPGYAYHWNTYKVHRWSFDYHKEIKNRTCLVIGFSPWLDFDNGIWTVNKFANKLNPTDMIVEGHVI